MKSGKAGQVCLPHSLGEEELNRAELAEIQVRDKIKGYKSDSNRGGEARRWTTEGGLGGEGPWEAEASVMTVHVTGPPRPTWEGREGNVAIFQWLELHAER